MLSRIFLRRMFCAVSCLFVAGCYGPGIHSQYPGSFPRNGQFSGTPYGQPQYLNQQYPGSYTVPGGVVLPPAGGTYNPAGGFGPAGTVIPNSTPTPGSTTTPTSEWGPADNWDSGNGFGPDGYGSGGDLGTGYGEDSGAGLVPRPKSDDGMFGLDRTGIDPTEPFGAVSSPSTPAVTAASTFRQPLVSNTTATAMYGYSGTDHSWLRGIVSPDPDVPNTFNIMYSLNADPDDNWHGSVTLAPHARFRELNLRPGDIVEVRGREDQSRAPLGNPMYKIDTIKKLN